MKRISLIVAIAALVAAPTALALDRAQAESLLRAAVKLSGLSAHGDIRIVTENPARFRQHRIALLDRSYPRAAQAHDEGVYRALGLAAGTKRVLRKTLISLQDDTGLYDPASRTAYVQAGAGERTAALRELVHGLQDQHVDLGRIGRLRGGADARVAATAAVDGYATRVTHKAVRHRSPRGSTLTRFLELKRRVVDAAGLRFETDLVDLGGTKAGIDSLRRLPVTSEQVFHLDKYLQHEPAVPIVLPAHAAGMLRAQEGTFGELDVRALLAVFVVPRLDRAAAGWGGGRTARYTGPTEDATVVALDWDTGLDALQWAAAVSLYVDAAFHATPTTCASTACWLAGPRAIVFDRSGRRTAFVTGADLAAAEALARAISTRT